jgi:TPR repeat protein
MVLGIDYTLTPLAKDLRRRCTCVRAAFAEPRVPHFARVNSPGIPLRYADRDRLIRPGLDRLWLDLLRDGTLAFNPDAGSNDQLSAATILVTGRGIGTLRGRDAIRAGVELYTRAAQAGHHDAQADLGYLYMTGLGVSQSDQRAAYWYFQGARNDSHLARLGLGAMYAVGRGVEQSDAAAVYWFTQAQKRRFVADAYACGFGVEQDLTMARTLYTELAERGDSDAQFQLGNMFAEACGAPLDDAEAAKWYEEAAQGGHPDAQIALSHMTRQGLGVAQNPWAAYQWAELAVLRLPEDDDALKDALVARAAAGLLMTPEECESASKTARWFVDEAQEAVSTP